MNIANPIVYAVAAVAMLHGGSVHATVPTVGEVTLTIGKATLLSDQGVEAPLARGAAVRPGDRIETAAGGHVHIRFLDGALVSVRPFSRLVVEEYRYDAAQAEKSQVRFRLEKGSTRAISGAAAEHAKDRFRLNTPLVAIGVRGTDFTVQTDLQVTMASVSQGAIVMAPLGADCAAQSYGPCSTQTAQYLSADMDGLLAEFRNGLTQPELRPQLAQSVLPATGTTASGAERTGPRIPGAAADGTGPQMVAALRQELLTQTEIAANAPPAQPVGTLTWGRWGDAQSSTDISIPREQARNQGEALVYGWPYTLYRQQPADMAWPKSLGRVGFNLQGATAQYQHAGATSQAAVTSGQLTVDFAASRYATQLKLNGVPYVLSTISAAGSIGKNGAFETRATNQSVAGAVTFDGSAAAYMFQKASAVGVVSGITHWSR